MFISPYRPRGKVSVSRLADYYVCPLYQKYVEEYGLPERPEIREGRRLHRRAYDIHKKRARVMTLEEAVERSYEERMVGREIGVSNGVLYGYVDMIIIDRGVMRVVEYKRGSSFSSSRSVFQALAYAYITGAHYYEVRSFRGERVVFPYSPEKGKDVEEVLQGYLNGNVYPKPGEWCNVCPFREMCSVYKALEGDM